jgi:hypothetical protein
MVKMNEIKTSCGVLRYRNPTIVEAISLVRLLRDYFAIDDTVGAKLTIMENIKDLFDYSQMDNIKSFEDMNNHGDEMIGILYSITHEILNKVVGAFAKKA